MFLVFWLTWVFCLIITFIQFPGAYFLSFPASSAVECFPLSATSSSLCLILPVGNNNKLARPAWSGMCEQIMMWKLKKRNQQQQKQQKQLIIIINNSKCDGTRTEARVKDFAGATRDHFLFLFRGTAIGFH